MVSVGLLVDITEDSQRLNFMNSQIFCTTMMKTNVVMSVLDQMKLECNKDGTIQSIKL